MRRRPSSLRKLRLSITRNGRTWRSGLARDLVLPPAEAQRARSRCATGRSRSGVDTYTGGAHCCLQTALLPLASRAQGVCEDVPGLGRRRLPSRRTSTAGEPSSSSSGDTRFAYVFTAFAGSPFPIQIWSFDRDGSVDGAVPRTGRARRPAPLARVPRAQAKDDVRGSSRPGRPTRTCSAARTGLAGARGARSSAGTAKGRTAPGRRRLATSVRSGRSSERLRLASTPRARWRDL